jgi:hypothetical protein
MGTMHTQQSAAVGAQHAKVTASLRRFNDREANVRRRILGSTPGSAVIGKKNAGVRPPCRLVWSRAETAAEAQAILPWACAEDPRASILQQLDVPLAAIDVSP